MFFFSGLSTFQESVAMDRIQRIMGVLQNPCMGWVSCCFSSPHSRAAWGWALVSTALHLGSIGWMLCPFTWSTSIHFHLLVRESCFSALCLRTLVAKLNSPTSLANDFYTLCTGSEAISERVKEMWKHMASQHDASRGGRRASADLPPQI